MRSSIALAGLTGLTGLAACAHTQDVAIGAPSVDEDRDLRTLSERANAADIQVSSDLARLDALQLFEVGELVGGDASQAFQCYGECPDAAETVAQYEARADRLADLADAAEAAGAGATCDMDAVDDHLAALRGLEVVEVGTFLHQQAAASPYCYNLPCPEDEAAAHEVNCARASQIAALTQTVSGR